MSWYGYSGCASRIVYLERTQRTKASHLLSYLFSVQYYFSSVISNRSRDQPQDSGLSVQRICSLPISYILLDPSPFHVLGRINERTNSIMATRWDMLIVFKRAAYQYVFLIYQYDTIHQYITESLYRELSYMILYEVECLLKNY